jgi:uncharacterized protein YgiM (DUF1202 family)
MKKHSARAVQTMRNPFAKPITPPHKDNLVSLFGILGTITVLLLLVFYFLNTSAAPTSTRMLVPIPTLTTSPVLMAAPEPVSLKACVTNSEINIRKGPGTDFEVMGGLVPGTCMQILGRNQDASWVYMVTEGNEAGWVAAWLLTIEGEITRVSVRSASNE